MKVYKADKTNYWINELKSWILTFIAYAVLFFIIKSIFLRPPGKILLSICVIFILKVANILTQYRATDIRIDPTNDKLTFILNSIMSGEKSKIYDLKQTQSAIVKTSILNTFLNPGLVLKIYLPKNEVFIIRGRVGFSPATLKAIDNMVATSNKIYSKS